VFCILAGHAWQRGSWTNFCTRFLKDRNENVKNLYQTATNPRIPRFVKNHRELRRLEIELDILCELDCTMLSFLDQNIIQIEM
jgi:hypothetical protein